MECRMISEVSGMFEVSTRIEHHYENPGRIKGMRRKGCVYRICDEAATRKARQTVILRKCRIFLKQIRAIFVWVGFA